MRVLLLGHTSDRPDEGVRKVFDEISKHISKDIELQIQDISDLGHMIGWKNRSPDVIHAVIGPSSRFSLPIIEMWRRRTGARVCILSAIQYTTYMGPIISRLAKLDRVLVQSIRSEIEFAKRGRICTFVSNGVDTSKFVPVSNRQRKMIRKEFGFTEEKRILLHVGPIKRERNVHVMASFVDNNTEVFIVSRPSNPGNPKLIQELKAANCRIMTDFCPSIEKIYQMSDGYIFPATDPTSCIETPLSILEACSCNLPILTTPFGGIPRILNEVEGVRIADSIDELIIYGDSFDKPEMRIGTRDAVLDLDWGNISNEITQIYNDTLIQKGISNA